MESPEKFVNWNQTQYNTDPATALIEMYNYRERWNAANSFLIQDIRAPLPNTFVKLYDTLVLWASNTPEDFFLDKEKIKKILSSCKK